MATQSTILLTAEELAEPSGLGAAHRRVANRPEEVHPSMVQGGRALSSVRFMSKWPRFAGQVATSVRN